MRVRMLVEASGNRNGVPWPKRGGVIDLPDVEAAGYCAAGLAEPVAEPDGPVETSEPAPTETRDGDGEKPPVTTSSGPAKRGRGRAAQAGS